jgi:hypothetical protein
MRQAYAGCYADEGARFSHFTQRPRQVAATLVNELPNGAYFYRLTPGPLSRGVSTILSVCCLASPSVFISAISLAVVPFTSS